MITRVPEGKRGVIRLKPKAESTIRITTHTRLSPARPRVIYYSGTHVADSAAAAAMKSVVAEQPHRNGSTSHLEGTALGRFCRMHWRGDEYTLRARYYAGGRFAQYVDVDRGAQGLSVRSGATELGESVLKTQAERDAAIELARIQREGAEAVLAPIAGNRRAIRVVYDLAYEDRDLAGRDHGVAINGLYQLALHFGFEKRPFHD